MNDFIFLHFSLSIGLCDKFVPLDVTFSRTLKVCFIEKPVDNVHDPVNRERKKENEHYKYIQVQYEIEINITYNVIFKMLKESFVSTENIDLMVDERFKFYWSTLYY